MKWDRKKLTEVVWFQRGFDLPKDDFEEGEFPVIGSTSILGYHSSYKVKGPTLITGRSGTLGKFQFITTDSWPHNTSLWSKELFGNNIRYVFYLLQTLDFKAFNGGGAVPTLNRNVLSAIEVDIPPLPIQNTIAAILTAYDDLIENNLQRIKLLEQAAKCEYKLLMKESESFEFIPIKDALEYYIGGGWGNDEPNAEFSSAGYVIRGTDIPELKVGANSNLPFRFHKPSNYNSRQLKEGDIVFEVSGGSKTSPVGRSILITNKLLTHYDNSVICASFCKLMRPKGFISSEYFYLFLQDVFIDGTLKPFEKPSASNIINFAFEKFIEEVTIPIPSKKVLQQFSLKVRDILQFISNLSNQNTQLRQARDILLPKLLSGAIDVSKHQQAAKLIPLPTPVISMVAEDVVEYSKYYRHTVLAAYFVDKLWKKYTFGHSKLMKLMYLAKHLKKIEFESNFMRGAAGPYDYNMLNAIDNLLQKHNWFLMYKKDEKYPKYKPINDNATFIQEFNIFFADRKKDIDDLIKKFGSRDSENVGMFTTIYEAWRYLKSKGKKPTQPAIINEIWNCWNDEKRNISKERWIEHYNSMINEGWIA